MKHRLTSLIFSCVSAVCVVQAAETADKKGYVTGSFETNTNYYLEDQVTAERVPDGNFGSNNYLKVDYHNSRFTAGLQLENYAPALVGYSSELAGAELTNFYVDWKDEDFSITAGSFYEQF